MCKDDYTHLWTEELPLLWGVDEQDVRITLPKLSLKDEAINYLKFLGISIIVAFIFYIFVIFLIS